MKLSRILTLGALAGMLSLSQNAMAANTAQINGNIVVRQPISVEWLADLNFGEIILTSTLVGADVQVLPSNAGVLSSTAAPGYEQLQNAIAGAIAPAAGAFRVIGLPTQPYNITFTPNAGGWACNVGPCVGTVSWQANSPFWRSFENGALAPVDFDNGTSTIGTGAGGGIAREDRIYFGGGISTSVDAEGDFVTTIDVTVAY